MSPSRKRERDRWEQMLRGCDLLRARDEIADLFAMINSEGTAKGGKYVFKVELVEAWRRFYTDPCADTAIAFLGVDPTLSRLFEGNQEEGMSGRQQPGVTPNELAALKQTLAEMFGIEGIDDPKELCRLGEVRLSEMNTVDRAAFHMRLGRNLDVAGARAGYGTMDIQPRAGASTKLLGYALLAAVAWFIWRMLSE